MAADSEREIFKLVAEHMAKYEAYYKAREVYEAYLRLERYVPAPSRCAPIPVYRDRNSSSKASE